MSDSKRFALKCQCGEQEIEVLIPERSIPTVRIYDVQDKCDREGVPPGPHIWPQWSIG